MAGESDKHFGNGRWRRDQLYAIVAHYAHRGETPEWVAKKLGIGLALSRQIFDYVEPPDSRRLDAAFDRRVADPRS